MIGKDNPLHYGKHICLSDLPQHSPMTVNNNMTITADMKRPNSLTNKCRQCVMRSYIIEEQVVNCIFCKFINTTTI